MSRLRESMIECSLVLIKTYKWFEVGFRCKGLVSIELGVEVSKIDRTQINPEIVKDA